MGIEAGFLSATSFLSKGLLCYYYITIMQIIINFTLVIFTVSYHKLLNLACPKNLGLDEGKLFTLWVVISAFPEEFWFCWSLNIKVCLKTVSWSYGMSKDGSLPEMDYFGDWILWCDLNRSRLSFLFLMSYSYLTGSRKVWFIKCDKNHRKWEESSVSLWLEKCMCWGFIKGLVY